MSFSITNKLVLISITAVASVVAVVIALSYINSSTLIENKFTKIVNKYMSYKKVKKLYNELEKDKNNNRKDI